MRKVLRWGGAVLAAAAALAISLSAQNARTRITRAPQPVPSEALEPATNPDSVSPASAEACANDGWRIYSRPKFQNQKSCELWVRRHAPPKPSTENPPAAKKPVSTETRTELPFLT